MTGSEAGSEAGREAGSEAGSEAGRVSEAPPQVEAKFDDKSSIVEAEGAVSASCPHEKPVCERGAREGERPRQE